MAYEDIKDFVAQVNNDKSLQDQIKTFTGIPEETYRKIIDLAKTQGYKFTEEEWTSFPKCTEPNKSKHGFADWSSEILVPWLK